MASILTASDYIYGLLEAAWENEAETVSGVVGLPDLVVALIDGDKNPNTGAKPWARATVKHTGGRRRAIGSAILRREGTLFVNVFAPVDREEQNHATVAQKLSAMFTRVLRDDVSPIVFKRLTETEIGYDPPYWQMNVTADFDYDQFPSEE